MLQEDTLDARSELLCRLDYLLANVQTGQVRVPLDHLGAEAASALDLALQATVVPVELPLNPIQCSNMTHPLKRLRVCVLGDPVEFLRV